MPLIYGVMVLAIKNEDHQKKTTARQNVEIVGNENLDML